MSTDYEQLKEIILLQMMRLEKLNLEKNELNKNRSSMNEAEFLYREKAINQKIKETERSLNKNQDLLSSHDLVDNNINNLQKFVETYENEKNPKLKEEISREVISRRKEIQEKLNNSMPEELSRDLKNKFTNSSAFHMEEMKFDDNKILELTSKREERVHALNSATNKLQDSILKMQEIFREEKDFIEKNGPFATELELNNFNSQYMEKKISENKNLEKIKKIVNNLEKEVNILDKKITYRANIIEEAKAFNISADMYEDILRKVSKRDELDNFLIKLGLNELVKKENQLVTPTKEELAKYREKIKKYLIENNKKTMKALPKGEVLALPEGKESVLPIPTKNITSNDHENSNLTNFIDKKLGKNKVATNIKNTTIDKLKNFINQKQEKEPIKVNKDLEKAQTTKNNSNTNTNINTNSNSNPDYGYKTIIAQLVKGLKPEVKDGKRYRASNIQIKESFKKELHSGNYLYNIIHVVPAIIKVPIQFVRKSIAKFTFKKDAKERMNTIKNRLDKLPEQDLMILFKEYSNHMEVERYGSGINMLIDERITRFVHEKVDEINNRLTEQYKSVFSCLQELDSVDMFLRNKDISNERRTALREYRNNLLQGRANQVASIRKDYEDAKTLLSSGLHGFNENVRATESKMSYVGYRFTKDHDLDVELLEKEAALERAERTAINTGNDEMALRTFAEAESLLSKNTSIEKSKLGKRSTGKKYYSPLAESLEYKNDPFIRDIFTTVAIFGAINTFVNRGIDGSRIQSEIDKVNAQNEKVINSVNNVGDMISKKRDVINDGIQAQNYQDSLNISNILEREALDKSSEIYGGWSVGTNSYYGFRDAAQSTYNNFYTATKTAIEDITSKYANNQITSTEALNMLSDVSKNSQTTLASVAQESLPHLVNYANNHAQFDLAGVEEAMNYIVAHPTAITNMNKAMIDVTELGDELSKISLDKIQTLQQIPDRYRASIFGAAAATALAMNVSNTMTKNARQGKYGNEVTNIVNKYVDSQKSLKESIKR